MRDFRQIQNTRRLADEALLRSRSAGGAGGIDQLTGEVIAGPGTGSQVAKMGPRPTASQLVYVNQGGSDVTGNGTPGLPFLTIGHAVASILDASAAKSYVVLVGPGIYTENLVLEPFIFVEGQDPSPITAVINGTVELAAVFPSNAQACLAGFNVMGDCTLNFLSASASVDLFSNLFSGNFASTGVDDSDSVSFINCLLFGTTATFTTVNLESFQTTFASTTLCQSGATNFSSEPANTYFTGGLTISAPGAGTCSMQGGFVTGPLVVTGANASFQGEGFPMAGTTVSGGATVSRSLSSFGMGYTPASLPNWSGTSPQDVQAALDRIAAKIGPIP
jgi:pectin methylesterase-like acyl-CoA thioesterase